MYTHCQ